MAKKIFSAYHVCRIFILFVSLTDDKPICSKEKV